MSYAKLVTVPSRVRLTLTMKQAGYLMGLLEAVTDCTAGDIIDDVWDSLSVLSVLNEDENVPLVSLSSGSLTIRDQEG